MTKSFTDDLAWEVQEKLVDGYFQTRKLTPAEQLLKSVQLSVELEKRQTILALQQNNLSYQQARIEGKENRLEALIVLSEDNKKKDDGKDRLTFVHSYDENGRLIFRETFFILIFNGRKIQPVDLERCMVELPQICGAG